MGLDKLKIITPRLPQQAFIKMLNNELGKLEDERRFKFQFRFNPVPNRITATTPLAVWTKPGITPFIRVDLQALVPGGKQPPLTMVETNPNKFLSGYRGLTTLVEIVFGEAFPELKISRIDCNADVPNVSVEYIRGCLRIPRKRKTGDVGRMQESYSNRGVETFYVGKSPAQLRVYDKILELKYQRQDTSKLPDVLTRVEWEFRERRCPVRYWGELPQMLDRKPFSCIQFLESQAHYNFRYDPRHSISLFTYNKLAEEKGAHEATRIINACGRHFSRNLREDVVDNAALRERVHRAWHSSTTAFFENRCADVRALYEQEFLALNAAPPIEFVASETKPLLGATETEALAIAAAGCRLELLQESRIFDGKSLIESPLFDSLCLGQQQLPLLSSTETSPRKGVSN